MLRTPGMMAAPSRGAVPMTEMRRPGMMRRPVRTAMFLLVVVIVPVVVVAVPLAFLFAFALGLGFVVVIIVVRVVVVIVFVVVVHGERCGHKGIEVLVFNHFMSEFAGGVPIELRRFVRRRSPWGWARRAKLAKFFAIHIAVTIAIELAECRRRCVDLRGTERAVVIGIEQAQ
jgi:hypothetical protein